MPYTEVTHYGGLASAPRGGLRILHSWQCDFGRSVVASITPSNTTQ